MRLGAPTVDIAGLTDHDRLLKALGLRRTCSDEPPPPEEVHHAMLIGMTPSDRNTAIRRLARLLIEAAGTDPEEVGDDER